MKTISRYLLTLVALLAMTTGAWAQESAFYVVGNFTDWSPDEAYKMTLNTSCTTSSEYMLTLDLDADAQFKVVEVASNHEQTWYPQGMGNNFGENGELPRAGKYTVYFRLNADGDEDWFYNVIKIVPYAPSTPVISDDKTSAEFEMPAYDATLEYDIVRNMKSNMTATVEDAQGKSRFRVEKANENMYAPVDMSMDDVVALITVTDATEQKDLTINQDYFCLIYPVDEEDKILEGAEDGVLLENFTFAPGRYAVRAIAKEESNYADTTALSNTFVLFEGYPVYVDAGKYITYYRDEALTLLETETEAKLYTITEVSGDQAVLSEAIETAPALTPLLIYNGSESSKTILLIPTEDPETELTWAPEFVGTLKDSVIAASSETQDNYALNGYAFVWVKNKINVAANKCWLTVAKDNDEGMEARSIRIVSGGEATGISGMSTKSGISGDWYDLNGRKLSKKPTKKGVYILNGKKAVVK